MFFWAYAVSSTIHWLVALLILTLAGFLPSIIAFARRHHNRLAILALNVFLGWTLIGWVLALVWALTAVRKSPPVVVYET